MTEISLICLFLVCAYQFYLLHVANRQIDIERLDTQAARTTTESVRKEYEYKISDLNKSFSLEREKLYDKILAKNGFIPIYSEPKTDKIPIKPATTALGRKVQKKEFDELNDHGGFKKRKLNRG